MNQNKKTTREVNQMILDSVEEIYGIDNNGVAEEFDTEMQAFGLLAGTDHDDFYEWLDENYPVAVQEVETSLNPISTPWKKKTTHSLSETWVTYTRMLNGIEFDITKSVSEVDWKMGHYYRWSTSHDGWKVLLSRQAKTISEAKQQIADYLKSIS